MPYPSPAPRPINTVAGMRPSNGWAALLARRLFPTAGFQSIETVYP